MSLAYNLAASLASTATTDEDITTLVIDHYTRTIHIPKGITTLGVESDDDVLRLNFKMPRYLGTVDLYNFSIRINYINAQGEDDVYKVTDKAIVGDNITFSWLVGPTAVAYKGTTKFNVCMVITDANSVIKQEYNTAVASLPVLQGMECSERVVSEYTDILEQWERRLFGIGDTEETNLHTVSEQEQTAIENKGAEVLATIPADYTSAVKMADESVRTKADAIIRTVEGEVITISDSSDDHLRGLKIFGKTIQKVITGKNLLPGKKTNFTTNGVTVTTGSDGRYTLNGRSTGTVSVTLSIYNPGDRTLLPPGTYTLSGFPENGGSDHGFLAFPIYPDNQTTDVDKIVTLNSSTKIATITYDTPVYIGCYIYGTAIEVAYNNLVYSPMIERGSVATEYEPYTGGIPGLNPDYPQKLVNSGNKGTISTRVCGKNLLDLPQTINKDRASYNFDLFTGTYGSELKVPEEYIDKLPILRAGIKYYFSYSIPTEVSNKGIWVLRVLDDGTTSASFAITKYAGVIEVDKDTRVTFRANSGEPLVIENVQLEVGTERTEYEPYCGSSISVPTPNGLPGIRVISGGNYVDSDNNQWICDEIDFIRGKYIQRIHTIVFDGSENITREERTGGTYRFVVRPNNIIRALTIDYAMCTHFTCNTAPVSENKIDETISIWTTGNAYLRYDVMVSADELASWLAECYAAGDPVKLMYILETPVERDLTVDELAGYLAAKTGHPNTTIYNDSGVSMEVIYNADAKIYIDNCIAERTPRNHYVAPAIAETASGETIFLTDSSDDYVRGLTVLGKTTQDATPVPDAPVKLVNVGDDGTIDVNVCGTNLYVPYKKNASIIANGMTITIDDDGTIFLNGTATTNTWIEVLFAFQSGTSPRNVKLIPLDPDSDYVLSRTNLGGSFTGAVTVTVQASANHDGTGLYSSGDYVAIKGDGVYRGWITFSPNTVCNNYRIAIQLEKGTVPTPYVPAVKQTLTVPTPNGLPGLKVTSGGNYTDPSGQQWLCDEIDFERGVYVKRIGQVTLSNDRTYYYNTDTVGKEFFYTAENNNVKAWETRMYCSHFPIIGSNVGMDSDYWTQFSGSGGIRFRHKDLTSLEELAAWLTKNPVNVCYPLATIIETPLNPKQLSAWRSAALHTNYPNTTIYNDGNAGQEITYVADTKKWIMNQLQ